MFAFQDVTHPVVLPQPDGGVHGEAWDEPEHFLSDGEPLLSGETFRVHHVHWDLRHHGRVHLPIDQLWSVNQESFHQQFLYQLSFQLDLKLWWFHQMKQHLQAERFSDKLASPKPKSEFTIIDFQLPTVKLSSTTAVVILTYHSKKSTSNRKWVSSHRCHSRGRRTDNCVKLKKLLQGTT